MEDTEFLDKFIKALKMARHCDEVCEIIDNVLSNWVWENGFTYDSGDQTHIDEEKWRKYIQEKLRKCLRLLRE